MEVTSNPDLKRGRPFKVVAPYKISGQQPKAIDELVEGINNGEYHQTLMGVTGSGKTFAIANVVEKLQKTALVFAPNKTLAAQLYAELRDFLPNNSVEYFVSYYDYYQPEAYVPASDVYIEKDSSVNEHIEQMRLSATKALIERRDVVVVCTVSAIYGLGDPESYMSMMLHLKTGDIVNQREILRRLTELQYTRNDMGFKRGSYRVIGDIIDIFPADSESQALRICLFDEEVEQMYWFDPLTSVKLNDTAHITVRPKTHYATPKNVLKKAVKTIEAELEQRLITLKADNRLVEHQRLEQRTRYDLEMIKEIGFCNGIENYSSHITGSESGEPPPTLLSYTPKDAIFFIDESHISIPQLGAMYKGDRSRKQTLVDYGFRLPSALDNRPLKFEEFEEVIRQRIYISATPAKYEKEHSSQQVELLIRPTCILDPVIEIRPVATQVEDLLSEINIRIPINQRVLVTTLTKRMSEDLAEFLQDNGIKARYLHSEIDTVERSEIIRDFRLGVFDALVGINLLREGLDMPEVSLVAILDADKEGFLRSSSALIQTIGRAARNIDGRAILYADRVTNSMQVAIDETNRRREIQKEYNKEHGLTPQPIHSAIKDVMDQGQSQKAKAKSNKKNNQRTADDQWINNLGMDLNKLTAKQLTEKLSSLTKQMDQYALELEFEQAAQVRDEITTLRDYILKQ